MQLYNGRPTDLSGRLDKEKRVYDLLDELGIEYARVDHPAAETMEACEEIEKVLGVEICKNLFLCNRQKTDFYLLMMPGSKPFKTKDITKQLGCARLSFAGAEFMQEFLDITPGSVSVMGLMNDKENRVRLVIDKDILDGEYIGCHPCINTSSLSIKTQDIINKFLPAVTHEPTIVEMPWHTEA
ncbi:MAG TPA: prolyl-tRNA synthetase associated domain-containing protein [Candidatus Eubacterium faecipullorum]|uniref:Prolyl-tRNA synthetase associated domain-containing protein n=1 Tax=Candidatus Eubacterium faecipullorum TaxID=2838571 RepID=A0A9D1RHF1_9FIRM|nr:prolyl-tRNA synthetase associated domain-containing protein [Candidatus Eubacterium faecipullorum]